jgi:hypothetical protein
MLFLEGAGAESREVAAAADAPVTDATQLAASTPMCDAHWRRSGAYLDVGIRSATSAFAGIDATAWSARLGDDLASGRWAEHYQHLLSLDALDIGHRLVWCEIAQPANQARLLLRSIPCAEISYRRQPPRESRQPASGHRPGAGSPYLAPPCAGHLARRE